MLAKVTSVIPLGAVVAIASSIALHNFAPTYELVAQGQCLGEDGRFGACASAARFHVVSGFVAPEGASGCLAKSGSFEGCSLRASMRWTTSDGALCLAEDECLGMTKGGKPAIVKLKAAAALRSTGAPASPIPDPKQLFTFGTYGAAFAAGVFFIMLFCMDFGGGSQSPAAPARPAKEVATAPAQKNGAMPQPVAKCADTAAATVQAHARGLIERKAPKPKAEEAALTDAAPAEKPAEASAPAPPTATPAPPPTATPAPAPAKAQPEPSAVTTVVRPAPVTPIRTDSFLDSLTKAFSPTPKSIVSVKVVVSDDASVAVQVLPQPTKSPTAALCNILAPGRP